MMLRLTASLTLALPFIMAALAVSIFGASNVQRTDGIQPGVAVDPPSDGGYGTLTITLNTVGFASTPDAGCSGIRLLLPQDGGDNNNNNNMTRSSVRCASLRTPGGSAPSEPEADVVACSLTTTCLVDGALAGVQDVGRDCPYRRGL